MFRTLSNTLRLALNLSGRDAASAGSRMITVDYHTHNARCGHAQGTIEAYIQSAIAKGLTEIGISDHAPLYWREGNDPEPRLAMAKDELDGYVAEALRLKQQYANQIIVRVGLEADYVEAMESAYAEVFNQYPFDYVIGSVHWINDKNLFDTSRWSSRPDPLPIYAEYYRLVKQSARSGLFQVLGHTSAIVAYAPQPFPAELVALQDDALATIKACDVALEVNTSGYRKMHTEPFPNERMLARAIEFGIPLTFSSDAHRPDEVGFARDKVEALLIKYGVEQLATFADRQRSLLTCQPATVFC